MTMNDFMTAQQSVHDFSCTWPTSLHCIAPGPYMWSVGSNLKFYYYFKFPLNKLNAISQLVNYCTKIFFIHFKIFAAKTWYMHHEFFIFFIYTCTITWPWFHDYALISWPWPWFMTMISWFHDMISWPWFHDHDFIIMISSP